MSASQGEGKLQSVQFSEGFESNHSGDTEVQLHFHTMKENEKLFIWRKRILRLLLEFLRNKLKTERTEIA